MTLLFDDERERNMSSDHSIDLIHLTGLFGLVASLVTNSFVPYVGLLKGSFAHLIVSGGTEVGAAVGALGVAAVAAGFGAAAGYLTRFRPTLRSKRERQRDEIRKVIFDPNNDAAKAEEKEQRKLRRAYERRHKNADSDCLVGILAGIGCIAGAIGGAVFGGILGFQTSSAIVQKGVEALRTDMNVVETSDSTDRPNPERMGMIDVTKAGRVLVGWRGAPTGERIENQPITVSTRPSDSKVVAGVAAGTFRP
jgi:hypothetical protein